MMTNPFPTEGKTPFYEKLRAWAADVETELAELRAALETTSPKKKAVKGDEPANDAPETFPPLEEE